MSPRNSHWRRALQRTAKPAPTSPGFLHRLRFSEAILGLTIIAILLVLAVRSLLPAAS